MIINLSLSPYIYTHIYFSIYIYKHKYKVLIASKLINSKSRPLSRSKFEFLILYWIKIVANRNQTSETRPLSLSIFGLLIFVSKTWYLA